MRGKISPVIEAPRLTRWQKLNDLENYAVDCIRQLNRQGQLLDPSNGQIKNEFLGLVIGLGVLGRSIDKEEP